MPRLTSLPTMASLTYLPSNTKEAKAEQWSLTLKIILKEVTEYFDMQTLAGSRC